jgi:hypothetical protein
MNDSSVEPAAGTPAAERPPSPVGRPAEWLGPILWLSLPIVVIDQLTKAIVRARQPRRQPHGRARLPDFTHVQNQARVRPAEHCRLRLPVDADCLHATRPSSECYLRARLSPHQRAARIALALVLEAT